MEPDVFSFSGEPKKVTLKELDTALESLADCTDNDDQNPYWNVINDYVLYRMWEKGVETFTAEDVGAKSQQLLVEYCLNELVQADLAEVSIDENGESCFSLKNHDQTPEQ